MIAFVTEQFSVFSLCSQFSVFRQFSIDHEISSCHETTVSLQDIYLLWPGTGSKTHREPVPGYTYCAYGNSCVIITEMVHMLKNNIADQRNAV